MHLVAPAHTPERDALFAFKAPLRGPPTNDEWLDPLSAVELAARLGVTLHVAGRRRPTRGETNPAVPSPYAHLYPSIVQ